MGIQYKLPPDPQHAVLKRIYPWENYNFTMIIQWLYEQAKNTGFVGTLEDFQLKYGIIDPGHTYEGQYEVIPQAYVEQILRTADKLLCDDVIVAAIPYATTTNTAGGYTAIIG